MACRHAHKSTQGSRYAADTYRCTEQNVQNICSPQLDNTNMTQNTDREEHCYADIILVSVNNSSTIM